MSNKKKATADYMQEDAFKEAVMPMLEQAYMQGYQAGLKDAEAAAKGETSEPATWALVDE